jgi:hypothetical protein
MHLIIKSLFIALTLQAFMACSAFAQGLKADISVLTGKNNISCSNNKISVSPDGRSVALWEEFEFIAIGRLMIKSGFNVISINEDGTYSSNAVTIKNFNTFPMDPIQWTTAGNFVFHSGKQLYEYDPKLKKISEKTSLKSHWFRLDIFTDKYIDDIIDFQRKIDSKDSSGFRKIIGVGKNAYDLSFDETSFYSNVGTPDILLHALHAPRFDYETGELYYTGKPIYTKKFEAYQKPLFDLYSGKIVGSHTLNEIFHKKFKYKKYVRQNDHIVNSVNIGAKNYSLTQQDLKQFIEISDQNKSSIIRLCDGHVGNVYPPGYKHLKNVPDYNNDYTYVRKPVSGFNANKLQWFGHIYEGQKNNNKDLLISFKGGPSYSLVDEGAPDGIDTLMNANIDVMRVEYSTSSGGGMEFFRRLGQEGTTAIANSMDSLAQWIRKNKKYKNVYVEASSFGSVPGSYLARQHPDIIKRSFFSVPFMKWDTGEDELKTPSLQSVDRKDHMNSGIALFGSKEKIDALGLFVRDNFKNIKRKSFYLFSDLDSLSRYSDFEPYKNELAEVIIASKMPHVFITGYTFKEGPPTFWGQVIKRIDEDRNSATK